MKSVQSRSMFLAGLVCLFAPLQLMAGFPPPATECGQYYGGYAGVCASSSASGCPYSSVIICTGGDCAGTEGNDCIYGTNGVDIISAGGGDDFVCAFYGDDVVMASYGWDFVCGGGGNDTLEGGWGHDKMGGQEDRDTLLGGNCNDQLVGGGHPYDACKGGNGSDQIINCSIADLGRQTPEFGGKCDL